MTKDDLLKDIAETGYNVGFGAKRHFATYNITQKIPSVIGFVSLRLRAFSHSLSTHLQRSGFRRA